MKSLTISYVLCALGLFSPFAGLHRFYLGRPVSGLLYCMTWGFFGIGTLVDMMQMPALVQSANMRDFLFNPNAISRWIDRFRSPKQPGPSVDNPSVDNQILQLAKRNGNRVTVQMVALETGLSLKQAQKELDRLLREDFCNVDVGEDGTMFYQFQGLQMNKKAQEKDFSSHYQF